MSVYNIIGHQIENAYDYGGSELLSVYDKNGNIINALDDIIPNRLLVWHDEFDNTSVDPSKWNHLYGYYATNRYYMYKDNLSHNAFCRNSILHIKNIKDSDMPNTEWTGAFIHTNNLFEFRYGLIEAKIKFPNAQVYHSTLWTLGASYDRLSDINTSGDETVGLLWATCGELDIAEADNGSVSTSKHWAIPSTNTLKSSGAAPITSDASNWHIYGCEWTEDTIKTYLDRTLVHTWNVSDATEEGFNAFRLPQFLMFNQNPSVNGQQTLTELETLVDWIRVYAPVGVTEYINEEGITLNLNELSMNVGDTYLLSGAFTPVNPSDMTLNWFSDNPDVAVCYGGKITATGVGNATIVCKTKHDYIATCKVTVVTS